MAQFAKTPGVAATLEYTIGTLRIWVATVLVTSVVALLGVCVPAEAQELVRHAWGRQIADAGSLYALDSEDNLYVTTGRQETTPNGIYLFHYSLNKHDAEGNLLWSRQYGREDSVSSGFAAATPDGNAYVAGTSRRASVNEDIYVIKYGADGSQLWSREFGSSAGDQLRDVAVDNEGNAYLVGMTYGALEGQSFSGDCDGFIVKYGADGARLWTHQFDSPNCDTATGVDVGSNGSLYVGGNFEGNLYGVVSSYPAWRDSFLAKYSPNGTLIWIRKHDNYSENYSPALDVEVGPGNNVFLAGFDDTEFILKYDSGGNRLWVKGPALGSCDGIFDIAPRPGGGVYAAAESDCPDGKAVVAAYGSDGETHYVHWFGTSDHSPGAWGVAANSEDYAYVSGSSQVFGDTGNGFLAKFNPGLELRPIRFR